ncbi:MAG TPA: KTSC domain-containing protein [Lysobacter sp.]|nr:KTSC domain-containing protein [Lysobacter sp.]
MADDKPQLPPVALAPVKSSNVDAIGYDAATGRMGVRFKGGAVYHYEGVTPELAAKVQGSNSIGAAVSAHLVKGGLAFSKYVPPKKDDG